MVTKSARTDTRGGMSARSSASACRLVSSPSNHLRRCERLLYLDGAQEHGLVIAIKRLLNARPQPLPQLSARPGRFQEKVVGSSGQNALHPDLPFWTELRYVVAVFDQIGRKKETAGVHISARPIAQAPADIRAIVRRRE